MQKTAIFVVACILLETLFTHAAVASNVAVGMNVVGINQLSETQQDALIEKLRRDSVTMVRTGFGPTLACPACWYCCG